MNCFCRLVSAAAKNSSSSASVGIFSAAEQRREFDSRGITAVDSSSPDSASTSLDGVFSLLKKHDGLSTNLRCERYIRPAFVERKLGREKVSVCEFFVAEERHVQLKSAEVKN